MRVAVSFLTALGLLILFPLTATAQKGDLEPKTKIISYVDRSLNGSQKYVLRVNGKPFYMTNIQVRLDKLRYYWGFDARAREAVIARAAADGFNTLSIPIHWYEVEPKKDAFDWTILDEYLGLCQKYNLKVELLWFSQNSGGHTQWLGELYGRRLLVHSFYRL